MPYIKRDERAVIDRAFRQFYSVRDVASCSPGEMNYIITSLLLDWLGTVSYTGINTVMGILKCVGAEFYRRIAAPYEDSKREENGDVYYTAL